MKCVWRCGISCIVQLAGCHAAVAQQGVPSGTIVVPWASLTDRPRLVDSAVKPPRFPDILRSAGVAGEVAGEVTVTPTGRIDGASIRVLRSTHDLFTSAVRAWIVNLVVTPPRQDNAPVATTMPVTVAFPLPPDADVPRRATTRITIDSAGAHVVTGWLAVARDSAARLDSGEAVVVMRTMFVELVGSMRPERGVAICLRSDDMPAAQVRRDLVSALGGIQPIIRDPEHCPPTYTTMILQLDAHGNPVRRPAGAKDPIWVEVRNLRSWTSDVYVATAVTSQATSGTDLMCTAQRDHAGASWRVSCEARRTWVSLR